MKNTVIILAILGVIVSVVHAQQRSAAEREIRSFAEVFAKEITPTPIPAAAYIQFAREVAGIQREHDAQLAEDMGAGAVAEAIRCCR